MSIQFSDLVAWCKANQLILGLLASAVIGTMPEVLPTVREFPQWIWTWTRESAKTFLNFRRGSLSDNSASGAISLKKLPEPPKPQTKVLLNG